MGVDHDTPARCRGSREHIVIDVWHPWVTEKNTPVAVRDAIRAGQPKSGRTWWCDPVRPPSRPRSPPPPPAGLSESDDMIALLNKYY